MTELVTQTCPDCGGAIPAEHTLVGTAADGSRVCAIYCDYCHRAWQSVRTVDGERTSFQHKSRRAVARLRTLIRTMARAAAASALKPGAA